METYLPEMPGVHFDETGILESPSSPLSSPPSVILTPVFGPSGFVVVEDLDVEVISMPALGGAGLVSAPGAALDDAPDVTLVDAPDATLDDAPAAALINAPDATLVDAPDAMLGDASAAALIDAPDATLVDSPDAPDATLSDAATSVDEMDTAPGGMSVTDVINSGKYLVDPRIAREALVYKNGVFRIQRGCVQCLIAKRFCDRASPCGTCMTRKTPHRCERVAGGPILARQAAKAGVKQPRLLKNKASTTSLVGEKARKLGKTSSFDIGKNEPAIRMKEPQPVSKPPGLRHPDIWCETRQELCEGLPYYRAYQSGAYAHDNLVHGYLLDGCPSEREYMTGKVVMSHCGGKSEDAGNGMRKLKQNQTADDIRVKNLLNNMRLQIPLVLLIGNQCGASPSQLPRRYAVMDWFKITHAWEEVCSLSGFTRWRFRFEKLDFTTDGWWASETSVIDVEAFIVYAVCLHCKQESPQVYEEGWMCMNSPCGLWWKIDGLYAPPSRLTYEYGFLNSRTHWDPEFETPPSPLKPVMDMDNDGSLSLMDVSRKSWKGMCCSECGRLSCREYWDRWQCVNCGICIYPKKRPIFTPAQLEDPHRLAYTGLTVPRNTFSGDVTCTRLVKGGLNIMQYDLPDCGTVTHILANRESNAAYQGADWLLHEYQQANLPFQRYTMQTVSGLTRTAHFTYNVGARYHYVANQPTVTFEDAHQVVRRARELLSSRVKLLYPEVEFNEILNVGYVQNQKMNFHQDGEKGLGPTVASISLGCPANMDFRIKEKKNPRRGKKDIKEQDEDEDEEEAAARAAEERAAKNRPRLCLKLHHGDIVIMHGEKIQTVWEHAATPTGIFRIAATARYISEENHTKPSRKPSAKVGPVTDDEVVAKEEPVEDSEMSAIPQYVPPPPVSE